MGPNAVTLAYAVTLCNHASIILKKSSLNRSIHKISYLSDEIFFSIYTDKYLTTNTMIFFAWTCGHLCRKKYTGPNFGPISLFRHNYLEQFMQKNDEKHNEPARTTTFVLSSNKSTKTRVFLSCFAPPRSSRLATYTPAPRHVDLHVDLDTVVTADLSGNTQHGPWDVSAVTCQVTLTQHGCGTEVWARCTQSGVTATTVTFRHNRQRTITIVQVWWPMSQYPA